LIIQQKPRTTHTWPLLGQDRDDIRDQHRADQEHAANQALRKLQRLSLLAPRTLRWIAAAVISGRMGRPSRLPVDRERLLQQSATMSGTEVAWPTGKPMRQAAIRTTKTRRHACRTRQPNALRQSSRRRLGLGLTHHLASSGISSSAPTTGQHRAATAGLRAIR